MAATELAIRPRMNDLPDEIVHITEGFIPLSRLLTRLVQSTHNALQAKVVELANLPLPSSAMNGNGVNGNHAPDDVTVENLKKKSIMLNFLQDMHTQWVKAYVIADWSRRADMASKLIDLKFHLDQQRHKYDMALDHSIHMKQNLAYAQLRSPDIKTGYQILATGCASFMPDLNYIEPPALPSNELLECVTELNTSLSLRLNVDEYDKIPPQFRDYTIASGRVTFSVKGEFEVDLTIADEDPAKQFWFIDFRFAFAPTAQEIPDSIRIYLEFLANNALAENGLAGCYQFLHEFVLSHKINELKRQALQLNRGLWDLKVEPLQRALAIQYWTSRSSQTDQMPKHWIMIGVNSDHVHAPADLVFTSSLVLKWYRDGQEVRDANIPMDLENLSVEDILMAVVGKHTHHILSTLHARFSAAPGFKETPSRELLLSPPETDPKDMSFSIPVGVESRVTLSVEPITGALHLEPHSRLLQAEERRLNMSKTPIEDAMMCLEQSRWRMLADIFARKAACCEWAYTKPPLTNEIIKSQVRIRERQCTLFFQRQGWRPDWYIMMLLCPAGDSCWAVQVSHGQGSFVRLALDISHTDPGASFWGNLDVLATGVMTQAIIRRSMLQRGANIKADESVVEAVPGLPQKMPVPVVLAKLSDLIPTLSSKMGTEIDADVGFTALTQYQRSMDAAESNALKMAQLELTSPIAVSKGADSKLGAAESTPAPLVKGQNKPWIYDMVKVAFKGFQARPLPAQPAAGQSIAGYHQTSGAPMPLCVSKVTIRVLNPNFFKFINYKPLGGDVVYSLRHGEFVFGVYHEMGATIIDPIIARVKAIDRLVDFIEAMNHVPSGIKYTSIKLDEVKFTYPDTRNVARASTMSSATAPVQPAVPTQSWPVTFDLSGPTIRVSLDHDDPHAPLTDVLSVLVNSSNGISSLMKWLPITLDLCAAITSISHAWSTTPLPPAPPPPQPQQTPKPKGKKSQKPPAPQPARLPNFSIEVNSLDWLTIRYDLMLASGVRRTVRFHANILYHEPTPWWHVAYVSDDAAKTGAAAAVDDPLAAALRQLCDDASLPFRPMGTAMAARPSRGTAEMLTTLDERVKALIKPPAPLTTPRADAPVVVLD